MALASTPGHTHLPLPAASQLQSGLGIASEDLEVEQSIQSGHSDQILERVVKAQLWLWLLVQM